MIAAAAVLFVLMIVAGGIGLGWGLAEWEIRNDRKRGLR